MYTRTLIPLTMTSFARSLFKISSIPKIIERATHHGFLLTFLLFFSFGFSGGYAQKNNRGNSNKNNDIVPVLRCVKDLRNGTYQASFGYNNPTRKEVTVNEDGSNKIE